MYTLFTVLSAIALVAAAPAPPMPVPDAAPGMPVQMSMGLQNPGAPGCGCGYYNGNWQGPYYSSCQPKVGSPEYLGKLNTHSNSLSIGPDADYACPYKYPYGSCDPCYGSDKFKGGYPCYGSENFKGGYFCPGSHSIGGIDYGCGNFNDFNALNNGWGSGVEVDI
jgi:hypothetical protein